MRSDDIFGRDFIDIVCRLLKVFAFGFCAVMVFSLINTNSFESWSDVTAVVFTILMVMSLIFLGHNLKKRWID
jgi:cell division protein FtsW (lipid II flippase)